MALSVPSCRRIRTIITGSATTVCLSTITIISIRTSWRVSRIIMSGAIATGRSSSITLTITSSYSTRIINTIARTICIRTSSASLIRTGSNFCDRTSLMLAATAASCPTTAASTITGTNIFCKQEKKKMNKMKINRQAFSLKNHYIIIYLFSKSPDSNAVGAKNIGCQLPNFQVGTG